MKSKQSDKDLDRLIAHLELIVNEFQKTLNELVAMTRPDHKPQPVTLVDPRTGKRVL